MRAEGALHLAHVAQPGAQVPGHPEAVTDAARAADPDGPGLPRREGPQQFLRAREAPRRDDHPSSGPDLAPAVDVAETHRVDLAAAADQPLGCRIGHETDRRAPGHGVVQDLHQSDRISAVAARHRLSGPELDVMEGNAPRRQPVVERPLVFAVGAEEGRLGIAAAGLGEVAHQPLRVVLEPEATLQRRVGEGEESAAEHRAAAVGVPSFDQQDLGALLGRGQRRRVAGEPRAEDDDIVGGAEVRSGHGWLRVCGCGAVARRVLRAMCKLSTGNRTTAEGAVGDRGRR